MSIRSADSLKVLIWGIVVGFCLLALALRERGTPLSDSSKKFHTIACGDLPQLLACDSDPRYADDVGPMSDSDFTGSGESCRSCSPVTSAASPALAQVTALIPIPSDPSADADEFEPVLVPGDVGADSVTAATGRAHDDDLSADFVPQPYVPVPIPESRSDDGLTGTMNGTPKAVTSSDSHSPALPPMVNSSPLQETVDCTATMPDGEASRKLTLRDSVSNQAVATLTITPEVTCEYMSPDERQMVGHVRPTGVFQGAKSAPQLKQPKRPSVTAFQDQRSGLFTIDANAVEIHDLAAELTSRFGHPIYCHESAAGSVSARVTDITLTRAVQRLVEPFGYVVTSLEGWDVIGTPDAIESEIHRIFAARQDTHPLEQPARPEVSPEIVERLPSVPDKPTEEMIVEVPVDVPAASRSRLHPHEIEIGNHAKQLIKAGDLEATTTLLTTAVEQYPQSAVLTRMMSEVYLHVGNLTAAKKMAERSLQLNRENPMTNQVYGEILSRSGFKSRAEHYQQQAKHLRSRMLSAQ